MASTITATIDGQEVTVDLARVTGLDALAYRFDIGQELDVLVRSWLDGAPVFLADHAVIKWLWTRQNGQPLAPLAAVASSVTLLPPSVDEAPSGADLDAPGDG